MAKAVFHDANTFTNFVLISRFDVNASKVQLSKITQTKSGARGTFAGISRAPGKPESVVLICSDTRHFTAARIFRCEPS